MAKTTTRKVTKVARTGGGRTKRAGQQRSVLFPTFIVITCVIGLGLIVLSRQQRQPDTSPPRVGKDHWHSAIGFDVCGTFAPNLSDASENDPLGIHTHGEGIVHSHPFSATAAGKNARLQLWFDQVGATVTAEEIKLPNGERMKNGDKCGDRPGRVVTKVWDSRGPGGEGRLVTGNPGDIRLGNNQLITVAFVPEGADVPRPPSEPQLDRLSDVGSNPTDSTVPSEPTSSVPDTTTVGPAPAP